MNSYQKLKRRVADLETEVADLKDVIAAEIRTHLASQIWLGTGGIKYMTVGKDGKLITVHEERYKPGQSL